jgi:hypothetical protein
MINAVQSCSSRLDWHYCIGQHVVNSSVRLEAEYRLEQ